MARPAGERDPALLIDMMLAARDALSFIEGMDEAEFIASALHQNALAGGDRRGREEGVADHARLSGRRRLERDHRHAQPPDPRI